MWDLGHTEVSESNHSYVYIETGEHHKALSSISLSSNKEH